MANEDIDVDRIYGLDRTHISRISGWRERLTRVAVLPASSGSFVKRLRNASLVPTTRTESRGAPVTVFAVLSKNQTLTTLLTEGPDEDEEL